MKKSMKLLSLMLSLALLFSLFPVTAAADSSTGSGGSSAPPVAAPTEVTCRIIYYKDSSMSAAVNTATKTVKITEDTSLSGEVFGYFPSYGGRMYEFVGTSSGGSADVKNTGGTDYVEFYYIPHVHSYRIGYNRTHHWEACRCGSTLSYDVHVDPATDEDSICTCGYEFSHNADLVTLWLSNMTLKDRFNREQTEYLADVRTYKPVDSSEVKYRTFDIFATVDAPEEVSIQEGMNVIEVTVTAEDRKTTKTYTVFASLASKADGILVSSTATTSGDRTTILTPQAETKRAVAFFTVSDAVGEKMAIQAEGNESTQIIIEPSYSKWYIKTVNVTVSSATLDALSQTKADLVIKTFSGNIVVPNAELKNLSKEGENLTFSLAKTEDNDVVMTLTADEKEVKNANITLEPAEK